MNGTLDQSAIRQIHFSKQSPAGLILITLVHHGAPGRIRVKVRGLYRSEIMKQALEELPGKSRLFDSVSANPLTGSALIRFEPDRPIDRIVNELERCARSQWTPIAVAQSKAKSKAAGFEKPGGVTRSLLAHLSQKLKSDHSKRETQDTGRSKAIFEAAAGPPRQSFHSVESSAVLEALSSREQGLRADDAESRLLRYGPNVLSVQKPRSALAMIAGQFMNPPVALLGLSAAVSIATGGVADALVILSVTVINAAIGYVTESKAERIIGSLGQLTPARALVVRDANRTDIALEAVVPGDILVLEPGFYIPADGRLVSSNRLTVDESALTGESLPISKHHSFLAAADTPLADRKNMVHRGTVVTGGSGLAVAVCTGTHTEIGVIQSLVGEIKPPETPLQRQLNGMGTQLALLSGGVCTFMFGLGLLRGFGGLQMLKSSISLAVAAVPEGLPAVATTTLALGIQEMQRRKVLVRQLPAVEGLGSIQTLCLDKTGTLTENRMRAVSIELPDASVTRANGTLLLNNEPLDLTEQEDLKRLLEIVCLCSEVKLLEHGGNLQLDGSPTESALVDIALMAGEDIKSVRERHPLLKTVHRAEDRPYMATAHGHGDGEHLIAVKGSPADVLGLCTHRLDRGVRVDLDEAQRNAILAQNEAMAGQALRVLGVAFGHSAETSTAAITQNLVWLGLVGMEDTLREGMNKLMAKFHEAGINTVMITGDQSTTAFSVGKRLGLNGDRPLEIVDSTSLDKLDPDLLAGIVNDTTVFARVSPAHKLRIVQALQQAGRVVAMTGDGINDGPALKAADVGVALGERGTEVARSVADVVLEDDNLHTMIAAVEQGRTIYANIRKSLRFLLSSNLSEIEIMLMGTAAGAGEVLNPMQLLWINLLTDILPGLGLALEPPEQDVLRQSPRDPAEPIIRRTDAFKLARESLVLTGGSMAVYGYSLTRYGLGPAASTNAFMTITLAQLLHAISCRSEHTSVFDKHKRPPNRLLNAALIGSAALQVGAAFLPPLRKLLRLSPIAPLDWLAIAAGATTPFLVNEGVKRLQHGSHREEGRS
ncbi:HAD-IC family P-type ATPase [Methylocaldum sp.]|uniref:cation-translocating P-type ATPase n=1 Tax=Methylocaldum sp. TaxID=1969727 RepID=UPI002D2D77C4|nr:HAD-IC family P-type ATPase [Methylocaldum sp.]HYE34735.1 HAD-IC family P-type ATPase [Methylocaldum sp.]